MEQHGTQPRTRRHRCDRAPWRVALKELPCAARRDGAPVAAHVGTCARSVLQEGSSPCTLGKVLGRGHKETGTVRSVGTLPGRGATRLGDLRGAEIARGTLTV